MPQQFSCSVFLEALLLVCGSFCSIYFVLFYLTRADGIIRVCAADVGVRSGRYMTDDEIAGMLIGLLMAGQHTSSTTSSWLGFFLAKHHDIQVHASCFRENNHFDYLSQPWQTKIDFCHFFTGKLCTCL